MKVYLLGLALVITTLTGCAIGSMPQFPEDIKFHYLVEVKGEPQDAKLLSSIVNKEEIPYMNFAQTVRCLEFEIVSKYPYKLKFLSVQSLSVCNGVGGYKPESMQSLLNWIDDIYVWAKDRKRCFKE
jgi:hypothetical protein